MQPQIKRLFIFGLDILMYLYKKGEGQRQSVKQRRRERKISLQPFSLPFLFATAAAVAEI